MSVRLPSGYSEELAELFGILLGDGSVTKYFTKVHLNFQLESEYSLFVKKLCQKLFPGSTVSRVPRQARGTWEVQISSIDVCTYLVKVGFDPKSRVIPSWIKGNRAFIRAAIRGLFDTEGTVSFKYYRGKSGDAFYKQLTVTNTNKNVLNFLEASLRGLGYRPNRNPKKNIYISNKLDIERYMRDIGSHNPKMLEKLGRIEKGTFSYGGLRRMVRH